MADYNNFFETKKEAEMRLRGTVVLYDGLPYYVVGIGDHKPDGIFRIYLDPLSNKEMTINNYTGLPSYDMVPPGHTLGGLYDSFMEKNPKAPLIRKMMNSPKFNKFRPFPLGMCNMDNTVYYIERQPTRRTEQGLTQNMLNITDVTLSQGKGGRGVPSSYFNMHGDDFKACILGDYPTANSCLAAMKNPKVKNNAAAFHREFAFVRGPLDTLYLGYKDNVIGVLPNSDLSSLTIGREFAYTREVVESLGLFSTINIQS